VIKVCALPDRLSLQLNRFLMDVRELLLNGPGQLIEHNRKAVAKIRALTLIELRIFLQLPESFRQLLACLRDLVKNLHSFPNQTDLFTKGPLSSHAHP
jgi:hypothetical protein